MNETTIRYEVFCKSFATGAFKPATGSAHGYLSRATAQREADEANGEEVQAAIAEGRLPRRSFHVVKATTSYEEVDA